MYFNKQMYSTANLHLNSSQVCANTRQKFLRLNNNNIKIIFSAHCSTAIIRLYAIIISLASIVAFQAYCMQHLDPRRDVEQTQINFKESLNTTNSTTLQPLTQKNVTINNYSSTTIKPLTTSENIDTTKQVLNIEHSIETLKLKPQTRRARNSWLSNRNADQLVKLTPRHYVKLASINTNHRRSTNDVDVDSPHLSSKSKIVSQATSVEQQGSNLATSAPLRTTRNGSELSDSSFETGSDSNVATSASAAASSAVITSPDTTPCNSKHVLKYLKNLSRVLGIGVSNLKEHTNARNVLLSSTVLATSIPLVAMLMPDTKFALGQQQAALHHSDGSGRQVSLQARLDSLMGWLERSTQNLPSIPRLHPQECLKRTICEAHNQPTKHGALGFMLRVFFPANVTLSNSNELGIASTTSARTQGGGDVAEEYKVINKYKYAADYGRNARIKSNNTNTAACMDQYQDCRISLLEILQSLLDAFTS